MPSFAPGRADQIKQLLLQFDSDDEEVLPSPSSASATPTGAAAAGGGGLGGSTGERSSSRSGGAIARGRREQQLQQQQNREKPKSRDEQVKDLFRFLKAAFGRKLPAFDDEHPDPGCRWEVAEWQQMVNPVFDERLLRDQHLSVRCASCLCVCEFVLRCVCVSGGVCICKA